MGLKENIKFKRLENKLTLEELANKIGVKKPTLQRYESGVISNIPSDKIEKLAKELNTTPAELMGWSTENKVKKTIAQRMHEGLQLRNMKQSELVELTGIGKSSISTYLSGAYEPKQNNIYKIAKALDVNEAWLMGYDVPEERIQNTTGLSKEETMLLANYNKLNSKGKEKLLDYSDDLINNIKYMKDTNEISATLHVAEEPATYNNTNKDNENNIYTFAAHDDDLTDEESARIKNQAKLIFEDMDKE